MTNVKPDETGKSEPEAVSNSSTMPIVGTEEEALKIQSELEGSDRESEADELVEQLARPKHGMA